MQAPRASVFGLATQDEAAKDFVIEYLRGLLDENGVNSAAWYLGAMFKKFSVSNPPERLLCPDLRDLLEGVWVDVRSEWVSDDHTYLPGILRSDRIGVEGFTDEELLSDVTAGLFDIPSSCYGSIVVLVSISSLRHRVRQLVNGQLWSTYKDMLGNTALERRDAITAWDAKLKHARALVSSQRAFERAKLEDHHE